MARGLRRDSGLKQGRLAISGALPVANAALSRRSSSRKHITVYTKALTFLPPKKHKK